jgi:soluble lytic murein transglycosylase-like protein
VRLPLLLAVALLAAVPAHAQIYTWRDGDGRLVLSNVRPGTAQEVATYSVPETEAVRTTRPTLSGGEQRFDDLIEQQASRSGIRQDLVRAVIQVESAFNPYAVSTKGAMGLMQLMPATARELGVANPFDPSQNIRGGVDYLRQLLDRYNNDERLALAAYNAGPGAVDRSGQAVPAIRETRDYVSRVSSIAGQKAASPTRNPSTHIYRVVEVIDGHEVVKYTDQNPDR